MEVLSLSNCLINGGHNINFSIITSAYSFIHYIAHFIHSFVIDILLLSNDFISRNVKMLNRSRKMKVLIIFMNITRHII